MAYTIRRRWASPSRSSWTISSSWTIGSRRLLGKSVQDVHRLQQWARAPHVPEPFFVDADDFGRPVEARERPVNGEAKAGVPSPDHQAVRLIREVLPGNTELGRVLERPAQADQQYAIGGIGIGVAALEGSQALRVIGDLDDLGRDDGLRHGVHEGLLSRRAGNHRHSLTIQVAYPVDLRRVRDEQTPAVDERHGREVHLLLARERVGGGA